MLLLLLLTFDLHVRLVPRIIHFEFTVIQLDRVCQFLDFLVGVLVDLLLEFWDEGVLILLVLLVRTDHAFLNLLF